MVKKQGKLVLWKALVMGIPLSFSSSIFAATPIDLQSQHSSILHSFLTNEFDLKTARQSTDFNGTTHIHFSQYYKSIPVFGGDGILHAAKAGNNDLKKLIDDKGNATLNGILYKDLDKDLGSVPADVAMRSQAALIHIIKTYQHDVGNKSLSVLDKKSDLIVYVDQSNKAHWAYQVTFYIPADKKNKEPSIPVYIVDAKSFHVYEQWNEIKNVEEKEVAFSGGNGGNEKMGKLIYDGLEGDLPKLEVQRDASTGTCYLQNKNVTVLKYIDDYGNVEETEKYTFDCNIANADHNDVFWTGEMGAVNGGYSPGNDALFGGTVVKEMYHQWYNQEVLADHEGKPIMLNMVVHKREYDNAYWNPRSSSMVFGDGESYFYPLTSLGVTGHEVSHGFTEQHAGLRYRAQSGGINEAFSDMAAQAAEVFAYGDGKNSWQIGPEIFKKPGKALRYMDKPSRDGKSIDDASQYYSGLNVHYSSGVYNRLFYLMGTSQGWNVKKAFDVMVKANMDYWTPTATFETAACGILSATKDYGYDAESVLKALETVKVDASKCGQQNNS